MKKIIAIVMALIMVLSLIGCAAETSTAREYTTYEVEPRFQQVYGQTLGDFKSLAILVDTETGTMYLWTKASNSGGLTVMLDETGAPMIWEER